MSKYDISVIVCTYNPDYRKLFCTLKSILWQIGINVQIIVTDDGSKGFDRSKIEDFLIRNNCSDYSIVANEVNSGTCKNISAGLAAAEGKYIKLISPGDYLYQKDTLSRWVGFMEKSGAEISYGEIICYNDEGKLEVIKTKAKPEYKGAHKPKISRRKQLIDYVFLSDFAVGVAFISTRDFMSEYLKKIIGRIIYTEDMIYRMAVWDGRRIACYNENVVWYEYGTGVSTSGNSKWTDIIQKDIDTCSDIIFSEDRCITSSQRIISKAYRKHSKISVIKYLLYPEMLFISMSRKLNPRYNVSSVSTEFYEGLMNDNK